MARVAAAGGGRPANGRPGARRQRWWTGDGALAFSLLMPEMPHCGGRPNARSATMARPSREHQPFAPWSPWPRPWQWSTRSPRLLPQHRVGIHWPNDVFVAGRKLAGILIEVLPDGRHVIGIGLNTNNSLADAPAELRQTAATLRDLRRQRVRPDGDARSTCCKRLEHEFARLASDRGRCRPGRCLCLQRGQMLTLRWATRTVAGRCQGIAPDGALLLETPAGTEAFYSGVVSGSRCTMTKCYFVSDLHLFANRSNAHHYLEEIAQTASRAETFVLGGDIFDFRWSQHSRFAKPWIGPRTGLRNWPSPVPRCQFHVVLGNHDYHRAFIDRLVDLEQRIANLAWHRYYVRLGSSVFLHGDVANKVMDARMLAEAREEWLDHRRRGPFLSMLYDVVVATRLHKPVPRLVFAKRIVVRRILKYLESIGEGPGQRRARRLLRPHAPPALELSLPRPGVPQRRRTDQGHQVPHRRSPAVNGLGGIGTPGISDQVAKMPLASGWWRGRIEQSDSGRQFL